MMSVVLPASTLETMATLAGIHPVREALLAGRPIDRVLVARGAGGARVQEIVDLCRRAHVPVRFEAREALDRIAAGSAHQGVLAFAAAHEWGTLDQLSEGSELVVVLDGVEDPHNLGAIVRTANAAGANAVLVPERRTAGLTETVAKAAAGALEHVPLLRIGNVSQALENLKARGYWIYALDERASISYTDADYTRPTALVFGGEGRGLHEHVRRHCDVVIRIPMCGRIPSLNVSVAAGVVLFEWRRRAASSAKL